MAMLTRQPKDVLTALGDRPRLENSLEKELVSATRGRSSATTTQYRTADSEMPRCCVIDGKGDKMREQVEKPVNIFLFQISLFYHKTYVETDKVQ